MYVFGGESGEDQHFKQYSEMWRLDTESLAWELKTAGNGPNPRSGHRMIVSGAEQSSCSAVVGSSSAAAVGSCSAAAADSSTTTAGSCSSVAAAGSPSAAVDSISQSLCLSASLSISPGAWL